jgi:ACT domain-containing protein
MCYAESAVGYGKSKGIDWTLERWTMRAVITVIGQDRKGIIAGVSSELANAGINILDISQTTLAEYFAMIMLVDMTDAKNGFYEIKNRLSEKGKQLGVQVRIQREDIFNAMHHV